MAKETRSKQDEINIILELIDKEKDFLMKNHKQLVKLIFLWSNLFHAYTTIHKDEYWSSRDSLEHFFDNDEFGEICSSAHYSTSNFKKTYNSSDLKYFFRKRELSDFEKLLNKHNKTMYDYIDLLLNEHYEYHSIYKTRFKIKNHILCVIGNGYDWNNDGFICSDENIEYDFGGWEQVELDERFNSVFDFYDINENVNILEKSKKLKSDYIEEKKKKDEETHSSMRNSIDKQFPTKNKKTDEEYDNYLDDIINNMVSKKKKKAIVKHKRINVYYTLNNYSLIYTIPENAHNSYWYVCKEIADEILENESETDRNKDFAKTFIKRFKYKFRKQKLEILK